MLRFPLAAAYVGHAHAFWIGKFFAQDGYYLVEAVDIIQPGVMMADRVVYLPFVYLNKLFKLLREAVFNLLDAFH